MGKKIDIETINGIISLFNTDMNDSDIAGEFDVSTSYVNKLRNKHLKHLKEAEDITSNRNISDNKEYDVINDISSVDEIGLLELKISSLKQTLKWYEELLDFKKKNK